jgi:hypothetical protein
VSAAATVLGPVRGLWGLALLAAPDPLASVLGGVSCDPPMRAIIRVLGAREAAQALVTSLRPARKVVVVGAAVDAMHSASMILLAAREPRLRRLAAASVAAAGLFAVVGFGEAALASMASAHR